MKTAILFLMFAVPVHAHVSDTVPEPTPDGTPSVPANGDTTRVKGEGTSYAEAEVLRKKKISDMGAKAVSERTAAMKESNEPEIAAAKKGDLKALAEIVGEEQAAKMTAEFWAKEDPAKIGERIEALQAVNPSNKQKELVPKGEMKKQLEEQAKILVEKYKHLLGKDMRAGKSPEVTAAKLADWEKRMQGDGPSKAKVGDEMMKHFMTSGSPKAVSGAITAQKKEPTEFENNLKYAADRTSEARSPVKGLQAGSNKTPTGDFEKGVEKELETQVKRNNEYHALVKKGDWAEIEKRGYKVTQEWAIDAGDTAAAYHYGKQEDGSWKLSRSWQSSEEAASFAEPQFKRPEIKAANEREMKAFLASLEDNQRTVEQQALDRFKKAHADAAEAGTVAKNSYLEKVGFSPAAVTVSASVPTPTPTAIAAAPPSATPTVMSALAALGNNALSILNRKPAATPMAASNPVTVSTPASEPSISIPVAAITPKPKPVTVSVPSTCAVGSDCWRKSQPQAVPTTCNPLDRTSPCYKGGN